MLSRHASGAPNTVVQSPHSPRQPLDVAAQRAAVTAQSPVASTYLRVPSVVSRAASPRHRDVEEQSELLRTSRSEASRKVQELEETVRRLQGAGGDDNASVMLDGTMSARDGPLMPGAQAEVDTYVTRLADLEEKLSRLDRDVDTPTFDGRGGIRDGVTIVPRLNPENFDAQSSRASRFGDDDEDGFNASARPRSNVSTADSSRPMSPTRWAALSAGYRAERIELITDEDTARDRIEEEEDRAFAQLMAMWTQDRVRMAEAAERVDRDRMMALQRQLAAQDAMVERGEKHRSNVEQGIVDNLHDLSASSVARRPSQPGFPSGNTFVETAAAQLSRRLDLSRPMSTVRANESTRSVRFVMTPEQEQAAEDTQAQLNHLVVLSRRRQYKKELMQRLLGQPAVANEEI
jgi:hypothetical protein